jgi:hypothetical protein
MLSSTRDQVYLIPPLGFAKVSSKWTRMTRQFTHFLILERVLGLILEMEHRRLGLGSGRSIHNPFGLWTALTDSGTHCHSPSPTMIPHLSFQWDSNLWGMCQGQVSIIAYCWNCFSKLPEILLTFGPKLSDDSPLDLRLLCLWSLGPLSLWRSSALSP